MLVRSCRLFFSQAKDHHAHQIVAKMGDLRAHLAKEKEEIEKIRLQVKEKEKETERRNKIIHQKRVKITEEVKQSEQVWVEAKKKSEANRKAVIQSFALQLVQLSGHFKKTKQLEKEGHEPQLKEGFDNTARLFFNTLQKFKICKKQVKEGDKMDRKEEWEVVSREEGGEKDRVFKMVEEGWQAEGKLIRKGKVILYQ